MIQTVRGKIKEEDVRNVLPHEHLVFGWPGIKGEKDNVYDEKTAYENCKMRIDMVRQHDVNLIVDPTPIHCGRDPLFMKKIAEDFNVDIVCATGFFKDEDNVLSILKALSYTDDLEKVLRDLYVKELTQGIGDTGIKAGIIKTASSYNRITALEEVLFKSAAEASLKTGVPIYTHCERGTMGLKQCELLLSFGIDPGKALIGHQTSNLDLNEVREILKLGFFIGFDQFGILSIPDIPSDEEKLENLITLLNEGYEDQILLSQDTIFDRMGYVSRSKPRYPDQIYKQVLPALKEKGFAEETLRRLCRENLLKLFQ